MKKDDRILALHELDDQWLIEHTVGILSTLERKLPEGELKERDQLYNAGIKFLTAIFSETEEKWNPQRRLAYKERYPFKYYQDGILESRKFIWGMDNILLPSWEPKTEKIRTKKTRAEGKTSTVAKNKDIAIKRNNAIPKKIFSTAEDIIIFLEKHRMPFYAAQIRKHTGLAIPSPEMTIEETAIQFPWLSVATKDVVHYMQHKLRIEALKRQYKDPLADCAPHIVIKELLKTSSRWNDYSKTSIIKKFTKLGYIKKPDYEYIHKTFAEAMENPEIKKICDQHDEYVNTILPIIERESSLYRTGINILGLSSSEKKIYFLDDEKIDDFVNHIINLDPDKQKDLDGFTAKRIIDLNYSYTVENENIYNAHGSAKEIAKEWNIIPKEANDDSIAV